MRIALTHPYCWPEVRRGGERYLHELSAALVRRGHEVTVWSSARSASDTVEEGARVVRLRRAGGRFHERVFGLRLLPHLVRHRYDVVHALGAPDAVAGMAAKRAGRAGRVVFTNLGLPDRALWRARRDRRLHELVVRSVDTYATLSPYATSVLEGSYRRAGVTTSGGVRLDRFPLGASRERVPTLLFAGTFDDPMKNVPVLLDAVALVAARRPEVQLWLVGPGDADKHVRGAPPAARERTVVLDGSGTDIADVLGRAWTMVLPSKWESFGLVIVEALACGTPVVVTDHSASPERVGPGVGVVCPPDDPGALAAACIEALALAEEPGIRERCRAAAAPYDWDALMPRYEAICSGST